MRESGGCSITLSVCTVSYGVPSTVATSFIFASPVSSVLKVAVYPPSVMLSDTISTVSAVSAKAFIPSPEIAGLNFSPSDIMIFAVKVISLPTISVSVIVCTVSEYIGFVYGVSFKLIGLTAYDTL